MAKDDRGADKARVKFRFVEVEMEGGSTALQETVKSIAAAISRGNVPPQRALLKGTGTSAAVASGSKGKGQLELNLDGDPETELAEDSEGDDAESVASEPSSAPVRAKAKRVAKAPVLLHEVDPSASPMPLNTYFEQVAIAPDSTDTKKYLAIAAWYKEHKGTPQVTANHVYTAFRFMGWNVPDDVSGPLRKMKKQGWVSNPTPGAFEINHIGMKALSKP